MDKLELKPWLPFETAPRDGTDILIYSEESEEFYCAYWCENSLCFTTWFGHETLICDYWMPLPERPKKKD